MSKDEKKQADEISRAALKYSETGFNIIPVCRGQIRGGEPNYKSPFIVGGHGAKDGTTDPAKIRDWFADSVPKNIGITCQNILVLDVDVFDSKTGKEKKGEKQFQLLIEKLGPLPYGPVAQTGTGGTHYFFKRPDADIPGRAAIPSRGSITADNGEQVEIEIDSDVEKLDVDIRVGNEYVVAPPSVNQNGKPYIWLIEPTTWDDLPELPSAWIDFLPRKDSPRKVAGLVSDRPVEYIRGADVVERCRRFVERNVAPAVQGQGGHGQLLDAAIVIFWNFGLEREEGWPIYMDYCARCSPPYDPVKDAGQIEHKYNEAFKKGLESGKSRGWMANWKPDNGYDSEKMDRMLNILTVNGKRPQSAPAASDDQPAQDAGESVRKPKFRIQPDADFAADIFASFGKSEKVIKTGFAEVDDFLDGGLSGLTILGGIPAVGKSSFALQIADHNAAQGLRVLIVSLEMSRKQLVAKTVSRLTGGLVYGHNDGAMLDYLNKDEVARCPKQDCLSVRQIMRTKANEWEDGKLALYQQAKSLYEDYIQIPRYILQRERGELRRVASFDIIEALDWYKQTSGFLPDLIVTDYLQLFDEVSDTGRDLTDKQQADQAVGNLKLISEDVPVIAVASFNRTAYYQPASRESFKESGGLEYTAEILLGLQPGIVWSEMPDDNREQIEIWKGQDPRLIDLVILKDRYGEDGKTFNFGMFPKCGGFYYAGEYKPKKKPRQSYRQNSPLMADVIAAISDVLRVKAGFETPLDDMFETMETECGFSERDVRRAINQPKSCLKRYNDANGIEQVRLITEKKKAADVSTDEPGELDEQDHLESID